MMNNRAVRLLAILFFFSSLAASASVQKIGPDLYAYFSENDASSNSTFLVSDQGILVVDTGLNAKEGQKLLTEIRKVSSAPVRWIVNTHYHPDHRGGNSIVGPDAIIISTAQTRVAVLKSLAEEAKEKGKQAVPEYQLNETFSDSHGLTLFVGGHAVQIYYPGPAHTRGDAVVYFPDEHAIATGDLFLTNSCPAMDDGDMENWIAALDHILTLPVEHVVPGHFELATKKELEQFRNYLADLRDQVARSYSQGMPLAEIQKSLSLPAYKDFRQYPNYEATFKDNAAAYYGQLERRKADQSHTH
jgi:glyoxylase-like metal-dependent hydrolase (beta-lactamase superfamily II)